VTQFLSFNVGLYKVITTDPLMQELGKGLLIRMGDKTLRHLVQQNSTLS